MINRLTVLCVLMVSLVFASQAAAEIYRWVDGNGNVHFSDSRPDAVENVQMLETGNHPVVAGVPTPQRTAASVAVAATEPEKKKNAAEAPQVEIFTARW